MATGFPRLQALPQMKVAWLAVSGPQELKREAVARLEVIAATYLHKRQCKHLLKGRSRLHSLL